MMIREQHTWRGILAIHREEFSSRYTQAGHAGVTAKCVGTRNYRGQFGRIAIPNALYQQSFVVHGARSVATPACFCRRSAPRATLSGAEWCTAWRNDQSQERHRTQNSQWPARVPNSPRSWHSFITLRPHHNRVNRTVAPRSAEPAFQSP